MKRETVAGPAPVLIVPRLINTSCYHLLCTMLDNEDSRSDNQAYTYIFLFYFQIFIACVLRTHFNNGRDTHLALVSIGCITRHSHFRGSIMAGIRRYRHFTDSREGKLHTGVPHSRLCGLDVLEDRCLLTASLAGDVISPMPNILDQRDIHIAKVSNENFPNRNGDFVAVWQHESGILLESTDLLFRRYEASGEPRDLNPVLVDENATDDEQDPRIGIAPTGNFVITWEVRTETTFNVMYRLFNDNGTPLTPATLVHDEDEAFHHNPDVAVFPNGEFIITWQHEVTPPADGETEGIDDIVFRRYDRFGEPIDSDPVTLNESERTQTHPRVAVPKRSTSFTFMITWTEVSESGDTDIWQDVLHKTTLDSISGLKLVTDEPVVGLRNQLQSAVDSDGAGRYFVTYYELVPDGGADTSDVFVRLYDTRGDLLPLPLDARIQVDEVGAIAGTQSIAVAGDGVFVVTYEIANGSTGTQDVAFQFFTDTGTKRGPAHNISEFGLRNGALRHEPAKQENPEITANHSGEFTIGWHDDINIHEDVFALNFRHDLQTTGVVNLDTSTMQFFLNNQNNDPEAEIVFAFGYMPPPGDAPPVAIEGDWDGDGRTTVGLYYPSAATFFLKDDNDGTNTALQVQYGLPRRDGFRDWIPVAGDWDGDGIDTIGAYDPNNARFYLRNANERRGPTDMGFADIEFHYGLPDVPGLIPVAGDWNGDGIDTVGLYNPNPTEPNGGNFHLSDVLESVEATIAPFPYGGNGMIPVTGDWDRDGADSIGVYDPNTARFRLRNSNNAGPADRGDFQYGPGGPNFFPLMGDWDGPGVDTLLAASSVPDGTYDVVPLEVADVQSVLDTAIGAWVGVGLDARRAASLGQVSISVVDLQGAVLGVAGDNSITLDQNAAGHGWFIDPTPADNDEFVQQTATQWIADSTGAATSRYDLLTAVIHELGHVLGFEDVAEGDVMSEVLELGMRRQPSAEAVDSLLRL